MLLMVGFPVAAIMCRLFPVYAAYSQALRNSCNCSFSLHETAAPHMTKPVMEVYYFIIENRDVEVYATVVAMVAVMYVIFS